MKKILLLLISLNIALFSQAQDTVSNIVSGPCENDFGGMILPCPETPAISVIGDSIVLFGQMGGNCGQAHMAEIIRIHSKLFVQKLDTGLMTTCTCHYCYRFSIKLQPGDSFLIVQNITYNLTNLSNRSPRVEEQVKVSYSNKSLKVYSGDAALSDRIEIYSVTGELILKIPGNMQNFQEVNIALRPGIYLIKISSGNRSFVKKLIS
jgi:hypothetical protein